MKGKSCLIENWPPFFRGPFFCFIGGAVADAKTIDEAKDIRDKAVAMAAYARQAKNRDLEADAVEIHMRAARRLDQLRVAQEIGGLNSGGPGPGRCKAGLPANPAFDGRPTLASQGIDKNLANQARKLGSLTDTDFEATVADARAAPSRATSGSSAAHSAPVRRVAYAGRIP